MKIIPHLSLPNKDSMLIQNDFEISRDSAKIPANSILSSSIIAPRKFETHIGINMVKIDPINKKTHFKRSDLKKNNKNLPHKIQGKFNSEDVRILKTGLKKNDSACVVISCLGLSIAWLESELFYSNKNISNTKCFVLRVIVSITCFILQIFIHNHYRMRFEIRKALHIIYHGTKFRNSNLVKYFALESIFCWIHNFPGLNADFHMGSLGNIYILTLDSLISVIMLGRLYIFLRLFDHFTFWTSERAVRVCRLMGFQPDTKFAVRALLKYKAIFMVGLSIGISSFFFALLVRTFERDGNSKFDFKVIWNCLWCVIVTMATIGYGDIYPVTMFGRLVIIIACFWGILLLSMFVVTLNNITQLTKEENFAFEEIIRKDKIKKHLKKDAEKIISLFIKLHLKKNQKDIKKKILLRMDLFGVTKRFKIKRNNLQNESKSINEQLDDIHDLVTEDMNEVIDLFEPIREAMPHIEEAEKIQGIINEKTVRVFENSRKIHTLLVSLNKGKKIDNVNTLNDVLPLYDHKENLN